MPIKYHAPSKGFIISDDDLGRSATLLLAAMKDIRAAVGLPLDACTENPATAEHREIQSALWTLADHAQMLGIDLGGHPWYKIDVRNCN